MHGNLPYLFSHKGAARIHERMAIIHTDNFKPGSNFASGRYQWVTGASISASSTGVGVIRNAMIVKVATIAVISDTSGARGCINIFLIQHPHGLTSGTGVAEREAGAGAGPGMSNENGGEIQKVSIQRSDYHNVQIGLR